MTTQPFRESEHPRSDSGKFAVKQQPEAPTGLELVEPAPDRHFAVLDYWEPDYTYPYPQANDLESVVAVVDIVEGGATTSDSIADALGMHPRQGSYYSNAAAWLGMVEVDKTTEPHTWGLTSLGATLQVSDPTIRAEIVAQMVAQLDDAHTVAGSGSQALERQLLADDLSPDTATRRAASMKSWVMATDDRTGLASQVEAATSACARRVPAAAAKAAEQRAAARLAAVQAPVYDFCPSCFVAMPATGVCDDCA